MSEPIPERQAERNDRLRLRLAQHLSAIEDLYEDLEAEAINRYDDHELPGGDAMVMLGPSANMEAWQYRIDAAEARYFAALEEGREAAWPEIADQDSDPAPPLLVLATWEDVIREERGHPTDLRATVPRAAKYLRDSIDWMLDNFLAVDEVARDLAQLRTRLEVILKDGIRTDRGVPCMTCGKALERDWGMTEEEDRWRCRTCLTWSTVDQYRLAVKADFRRHAEWLTAAAMTEEYHVNRGTLQGWASKGRVRKRKSDGQTVYNVEQALDCRDADVPA